MTIARHAAAMVNCCVAMAALEHSILTALTLLSSRTECRRIGFATCVSATAIALALTRAPSDLCLRGSIQRTRVPSDFPS